MVLWEQLKHLTGLCKCGSEHRCVFVFKIQSAFPPRVMTFGLILFCLFLLFFFLFLLKVWFVKERLKCRTNLYGHYCAVKLLNVSNVYLEKNHPCNLPISCVLKLILKFNNASMQSLSLLELLQSAELKPYFTADILACNCRKSTDFSYINDACIALRDDPGIVHAGWLGQLIETCIVNG